MGSDPIIERIKNEIDIVEYIGRFVSLRKGGKDHVGLCPFHNEKTPSFQVIPDKKFFHCFGCKASGDVIKFLMQFKGLSFPDAKAELAREIGIETREDPRKKAAREQEERAIAFSTLVRDIFHQGLSSPAAQNTVRYLQERGIAADEANHWKLGFGVPTAELYQRIEAAGFQKQALKAAGFTNEDGSRHLFENRLVFPIEDGRGRVIAFGARRIGDGHGPKYINARDSKIFQKKKTLYGWSRAQEQMRRTKSLNVVEGFIDVIACHRVGLTNTVASLGTAFTQEHAELCSKFTETVLLAMDRDSAGERGLYKAAEHLLEQKLKCKVVGLPEGEDPDSLLRTQGRRALEATFESAEGIIEATLSELKEGGSLSVEAKLNALERLSPLIAAIGGGLEYDLYIEEVAQEIGLPAEKIRTAVQAAKRKPKTAQSDGPPPPFPPAEMPPGDFPPFQDGPPPEFNEGPPPDMPAFESAPQHEGFEFRAPTLSTGERRRRLAEEACLEELCLYPELKLRFDELSQFAYTEAVEELLQKLAEEKGELKEAMQSIDMDPKLRGRLLSIEPAKTAGEVQQKERADSTFEAVKIKLQVTHKEVAIERLQQQIAEAEHHGDPVEELIRRKQEHQLQRRHLLSQLRR
ncbi:MAG: DNA primase [Myxococcota bacterium]|nr:DNA primase [Myxococcota bacterium]